jgi:hypothetical protein
MEIITVLSSQSCVRFWCLVYVMCTQGRIQFVSPGEYTTAMREGIFIFVFIYLFIYFFAMLRF